MVTPLDDHLTVVAAQGLPGARPLDATEPLAESEFGALLRAAGGERIAGHLVAAIDSGTVPATDGQRARAQDRHEAAMAVDLHLERVLVAMSGRLGRDGIEHRALKGPVLARTAYPDPALRSFGDVDLLVEGARFDDAVAVAATTSGDVRYGEPRPGFRSRFGKGVCVVQPDGWEVDLHRVFTSGPFGLAMRAEDVLGDAATVTVGGVAVPALGPTSRFLHACYHAALGSRRPRRSALRDIAQILHADPPDPGAAVDVATRWRGRAVLQRALWLTQDGLAAPIDGSLVEWAASYRPDRFERLALAAYTSERASYAVQAATGIWALGSWRDQAAYSGALLLPSREYLSEREGSYLRRWRRAVRLGGRWGPSS